MVLISYQDYLALLRLIPQADDTTDPYGIIPDNETYRQVLQCVLSRFQFLEDKSVEEQSRSQASQDDMAAFVDKDNGE